ncbi:MAG: glycosyltransferase family 39 protein [Hyphomicrobiales bacterium]|nr:glycosyltransferase family 39 protein [Hyphomicrobiales bacterium]
MLYVSIFVELLRSRPALAVWLAALMQALLWTLVPAFFYTGPPGEVANVLAVGHEFQLGTYLGPPLAFWLAELVYDLSGRSLFAVYLLSQVCVVVTYWAIFTLGTAIVGAQHAALAVLLMVGVAAFTVPTPDFGPVVLTMPLWAIILLHYWRAIGEGKRAYWLPLAVEIGLLLLTTYVGLILIGLLLLFTLTNPRARATLNTYDPLVAAVVAGIVMGPHLVWLADSGEGGLLPVLARLRAPEAVVGNMVAWVRQIGLVLAAHAGLLVLVALVAGWPWPRREPAPVIVRQPIDPLARRFVYFFGVVPAFVGTLVAVLIGWSGPVGGIAPLVLLSGLMVVVAAGDGIELSRQHVVIAAWWGLLLIPPAMAAAALIVLPWLNVDLRVAQPAPAMARFFAETFERRTGAPLQIVTGDPRTAALVALAAPSRPSVFLSATPERSPWVPPDAITAKGAIVVWPTPDTSGTVPPALKERWPDLVPEVPRAFERTVQGRLPLVRVGWAVIRPQSQQSAGVPPAPVGGASP